MAGHWYTNAFDAFHWFNAHWIGAELGVASLDYEAVRIDGAPAFVAIHDYPPALQEEATIVQGAPVHGPINIGNR